MKSTLLGAAALVLASTSAHAVEILIDIDDFSTDQGPVVDTTIGGAVTDGPLVIDVAGNSIERTISLDLVSSSGPVNAQASVAGGAFDIALGTDEDAEARLIYGIDALSDDFAALGSLTDLALLVDIRGADGTEKSLEAILNGTSLGVFTLPDLVNDPTTLTFDLDPAIEVGGTLEFVVNGNPGYDLAFELLGFQATQEQVPAPAMLGLFGLGLVGVAAARRRR